MTPDRLEDALHRGLAALEPTDPPPDLEALVRRVQAEEERRLRADLQRFALVALAVITLVLVALANSPVAFAALQLTAAAAAVVTGLRAPLARSPR